MVIDSANRKDSMARYSRSAASAGVSRGLDKGLHPACELLDHSGFGSAAESSSSLMVYSSHGIGGWMQGNAAMFTMICKH
jgi:hypothetical protein